MYMMQISKVSSSNEPILVYLDVRGVEIPLLSTVSISNCRYQEAPGEVVWSDFTTSILFSDYDLSI